MKTKIKVVTAILLATLSLVLLTKNNHLKNEKACVYMSLMGEQSVSGYPDIKEQDLQKSISQGEEWIIKAQNMDGGWGAGSHHRQNIMDPHAVSSDPATTAMSALALYRLGYSIKAGKYKEPLQRALDFLLSEIEQNKNETYITQQRNTQIQNKLGANIDASLALQFLNKVIEDASSEEEKNRIKNAIQICVNKIGNEMDQNGGQKGAGWAGVLQSSYANRSLEVTRKKGDVVVADELIDKSRSYLKNKTNSSGEVDVSDGAGIMLYSVSSSLNASAEERKEAIQAVEQAKKEGKLDEKAPINAENLRKIGFDEEASLRLETAVKVYNVSKEKAREEKIQQGFGNNGGEEFLSFLQTGESLVTAHDQDWKNWYEEVKEKLIAIQNQDGSWNGHHCITSPVFCTATCLLILSIENDIQQLQDS